MTGSETMTIKIDGYCVLGVDREYELREYDLLKAMDRAEVDRAVIAPVDRFLAVNNRPGNDAILRSASAHPDRFLPACCANPWNGTDAVEELERALGQGARLIVIHPAVQGFLANDELIWPLLELAGEEKVPVYIHTGPPGCATPWQIVDLAERFPNLDIILGHSGATDFWNDVPDAVMAAQNVFLEASLARPFNFKIHLEKVGYEKGIMGSYAPLNDLEFEWEQMRKTLLSESHDAVLGGNLLRLFEKRGPL